MRKDVPLPTQDCCCHRIEIIADGPDDARVSACVSELSSSRVFQVQLAHLEVFEFMAEEHAVESTPCGQTYDVYKYTGGSELNPDSKKGAEGHGRAGSGIFAAMRLLHASAPRTAEGHIALPSYTREPPPAGFQSEAEGEAWRAFVAAVQEMNTCHCDDRRQAARAGGA